MCSSPKGSGARRPQAKKKTLNREEYAEYSSMLRRSSAAYEQAQERKAERRKQEASKKPIIINQESEDSIFSRKRKAHIWGDIKDFLFQPVTLSKV